MIAESLRRALRGPVSPGLRPLPPAAAALLQELNAPPRLAAHLRIVHDVACELAGWADQRYPALVCDKEAMLFGAATHDIGKTTHVGELSGPGSAHEEAGRHLLLAAGISPDLARFAATHASWNGSDIGPEDLIVSVADKVWKNKRVSELEDLLVARLAQASGRQTWEEFIALDELLGAIGAGADERLALQSSFPIHA